MPLNSVNTNTDASVALQNLNTTNSQLAVNQNQINTGFAIASASDNSAVWAIAQTQRSQVGALSSVTQSLQRGQSAVDVALSAGGTVSDLLNQIKTKVLAAADTSLDTNSRTALNIDFKSLVSQITTVVGNASFNGVNLISHTGGNYNALANANASSTITVLHQDLSVGGANVTLAATASFATATVAQGLITTINTSIQNVNTALGKLGTGAKALQSQLTFVGQLSDTLNTGIGNLVDADLAKASANLQALQTKQQLGIQALSIANSETGTLLSLFRNVS